LVDVVLNGGPARVESLLKQGADPNAYSREGITPLMVALSGSNVLPEEFAAVRQVLYKYGANPNLGVKPSGASPLMGETLYNRRQNVQELLQHGANPNAQNTSGQTALMWAMRNGHDAIADLLLDQGANPDVRDKQGRSALDIEKEPITTPDFPEVPIDMVVGANATPAEKNRQKALFEKARQKTVQDYISDMRKRRAAIVKMIKAKQISVPQTAPPNSGKQ
jgi:hypothetical protein